jgi:hypothetical protein
MALLLRRLHPLVGRGYTVVGPTIRDGAIVLAELACADELPYGWGVPPGAWAATEPAEARTLGDRLVQVHLDAGMNDSPVDGDTITPDAAARVLLASGGGISTSVSGRRGVAAADWP